MLRLPSEDHWGAKGVRDRPGACEVPALAEAPQEQIEQDHGADDQRRVDRGLMQRVTKNQDGRHQDGADHRWVGQVAVAANLVGLHSAVGPRQVGNTVQELVRQDDRAVQWRRHGRQGNQKPRVSGHARPRTDAAQFRADGDEAGRTQGELRHVAAS